MRSCVNGHPVDDRARFCPLCGVGVGAPPAGRVESGEGAPVGQPVTAVTAMTALTPTGVPDASLPGTDVPATGSPDARAPDGRSPDGRSPDAPATTVLPVVGGPARPAGETPVEGRTDVFPVTPAELPLPSVLRKEGGPTRRPAVRLIVAVTAAVVTVGGVVLGLALASGGHRSPPPDGLTGMAALIDRSAAARGSVNQTIAGVETCRLDAHRALGPLANAVRVRQQALTDLKTVNAPARLSTALQEALRLSLEADRHFQDWVSFVALNGCAARASHNADFAAGNASSAQASEAKQRFVGLWNQVAAGAGLRQYHAADL